MKKHLLTPFCAFLITLAACSEATDTTARKEAEKPPEPVTGQSALYKMYQVARTWDREAEVLKMNSIPLADVAPVPGKAAAWEATFTSAAKGKKRSWTYSVIESEGNLHKGVFGGLEESWSGSGGQTSPFLAIACKKDTDEALATARAKGVRAEEYDRKNPGKIISFVLEKIRKYPDPVWRVIWGESVSTSDYSVYVDASTGGYLETLH
ncbi:MAG: hypothetical protein LAQ30_11585 [Acidobacteriia bacterium]|nr:hypothetical protein [Terriglobia bacterium]